IGKVSTDRPGKGATTAGGPSCGPISAGPFGNALLVEPNVFHAPIVVDAVASDGYALCLGLPAGGTRSVEDHWPGTILGKPAFDLPNEALSLFLICFRRLLIKQFVDLRIAIAVDIVFGATRVILVEILVGVVDPVAGKVHADREVLAGDLV